MLFLVIFILFVLVYLTEENIYKMNYIDIEDDDIQENVINNNGKNFNVIEIINEEIKQNELEIKKKIAYSNEQNLNDLRLINEKLVSVLEFDISKLLINQGAKQFLIYQENLSRVKEANIACIQGTIIKILPKNVYNQETIKMIFDLYRFWMKI